MGETQKYISNRRGDPNIPRYVYIQQPENTQGIYKIGVTSSLPVRQYTKERNKTFRYNYVFYLLINNPFNCEAVLHQTYWKQRITKDWFVLSEQNLHDIKNYLKEFDNGSRNTF